MSNEVINPDQQFLDASGDPLGAGTLTFYTNLLSSTVPNLSTIYSDEALTVPQDNPYTLDASGRILADIKYVGKKRMVVKDFSGATLRTIDNVSTSVDSSASIGKVATFAALATTPASVGQLVTTSCHTIGKVGGHTFVAYAATVVSDHGSQSPSATTGVSWTIQDRENMTLYSFGGNFEGDCTTAMNYFLASTIEKIKVPNSVTLGPHSWSATRKIIEGGNAVTFTGSAAGFAPIDIEYLEIHGFTNCVMSSTESDAHRFFYVGSGGDHGVVKIHNNSGGGGIGGVIANYENGRTIREIFILDNDFNDQIGEVGGTGYAYQYANGNASGVGWIERNKATRSGRHSFYVARNLGGMLHINNNVAIDHRENSTGTRGNIRPAFAILRAQNVAGYGNEVNGFYDGAFVYEWENEVPALDVGNPIYEENISFFATTIRNPKNTIEAISYGLQSPDDAALRGVSMYGIKYYVDAIAAPLFAYNYGHNLDIDKIFAWYKNMPAGTFRLGVISADAVTNSSNHHIGSAQVFIEDSTAATFQAYRLEDDTCTAQIKTVFGRLDLISDAASNVTFNPAASIDNLLIELEPGIDEDGLVFNTGNYLARTKFKSGPTNVRDVAGAILTPVGTVLPLYLHEEIYLTDPASKSYWRANGLTNADWVLMG